MAVSNILRRSVLLLQPFRRDVIRFQKRSAYIILLPEIPEDTPLTNPLLLIEQNPQFKKITAENCFKGVGRAVLDYECSLQNLTTNLKDASREKTFETVIEPIEKLSVPLNHVWTIVKVLYLVKFSQPLADAYTALHRRVRKARTLSFQNLPIYYAAKELYANKDHLDETQQRVIGKYMLEAKLGGIELSIKEKEHFVSVLNKISKEKETFRKKVEESTSRFKYYITDPNQVKEFPPFLLRQMAADNANPSRGPWQVSLQLQVYHGFMTHCSNSEMRAAAWMAYMSRASSFNESALNASVNIEEIRFLRRDEAKLLGYKTFAEMSMETKMAGSVEMVMSMIATLHKWGKPKAIEDLKKLQEFASAHGFMSELQPWDIPYWAHQQKQELYHLDDDNLRQYFSLPTVLENLFGLCHTLFGIHVKDATEKVQTWDDSVSYYEVYENDGKLLGAFYFDPFARQKKVANIAWIDCGINRSDVVGTKPVAYLVLNLYPPVGEVPCLLGWKDVEILFEKFGHCLQHILTTMPYSDVAGLVNVEWDAVHLCPLVMLNLLYNERTLEKISSHYQTSKPLPASTIQDLQKARYHMKAFNLCHQLYLSALDLNLYTATDYWGDIMKECWNQYMVFPLHKKDMHPCSFLTIFCEDYPAAYYSHIWAEMIAADVYSAFTEADKKSMKELKSVGRRFRDTFLSYGGGCHPSEIFRRFRGRDPSPDALLKNYGLK